MDLIIPMTLFLMLYLESAHVLSLLFLMGQVSNFNHWNGSRNEYRMQKYSGLV